MAENKICPVCHTINAPTARECECGYRFSDGGALTDRDIARKKRNKKLRAIAASCLIIAVFAVLAFLTLVYGVRVLLYVLASAVGVLIIAFIVLKILGMIDDKRGKR